MPDIAINTTSILPNGLKVSTKPSFLVYIDETFGKIKLLKYFITIDKPELLNGFVQVKGIFADKETTEEDIISNYSTILTNASKDLYLELMIPWHKIHQIRSLMFKAK